MDIKKVLAELREERDLIDQAIANLEKLAPMPLGDAVIQNISFVEESKPQLRARAARSGSA